MGNNQSSGVCNRLCPGSTTPPLHDDSEWFDTGKKKGRKKQKKPLPNMPSVPEESDDLLDEKTPSETTTVTYSTSSTGIGRSVSERSVSSSGDDGDTPEKFRRHSDSANLTTVNSNQSPTIKLTFVNGQFIDLSTPQGKDIVAAAKAAEAGESPTDGIRRNEISGVEASIFAGHGGVLPTTSGHRKTLSEKLGRDKKTTKKSESDVSASSCKTVSSKDSNVSECDKEGHSRTAVTSIIALGEAGDGYFLTASKYDRVIKMWRATDNSCEAGGSNAKPNIEFVRDFVGHHGGVTSLVRIDNKGRFLSASKDSGVFLWDSRYNCGDDEEDEQNGENRTLLAKFEKLDRRSLQTIAMVQEGSYVRPDDDIDFAMLKAAARKTIMGGAAGLQQAAQEKQVIGCSCEFATITGHHNSVKIWSVNHCEDQGGNKAGGNCAEATLSQEIKNDIVIQSLATVVGENILVIGDRMGNIKLWRGGKGMLGGSKTWTCERTFGSKKKGLKGLQSVDEVMNGSVTALSFLSKDIFVSGTRGGTLKLWNVDSEKDLIGINGAHNEEIVDVKLGNIEHIKRGSDKLIFSSASEDGKVLSFSVTLNKNEKTRPLCFDAVNFGITSRYFSNRDKQSVEALECVEIPNSSSEDDSRKVLMSSCSMGDLHMLKTHLTPEAETEDALLLHRKHIEEEALTLYSIAPGLMNGVEVKDRKKMLIKHKQSFLGRDAVSYLVKKGYAIGRQDAVDLGRILASHLNLFHHAYSEGRLLEDDEGFYKFSDECVSKWGGKRGNVSKSTRT